MILSDASIIDHVVAGKIGVDPFDWRLVGPCSLDVKLGNSFRVFDNSSYPFIDTRHKMDNLTSLVTVEEDDRIFIHPGEVILAETAETITLPADILARLEGRSSLARIGLSLHTAGFIDAGFSGTITLELSNLANVPIALYPGLRVGQLCFEQLDKPAERPYKGKYLGQSGPTESRIHLDRS